ncbi:MAG: PQQ-binding-like beta-propeller repeat protein, partial [Armatimonadota bacterium]
MLRVAVLLMSVALAVSSAHAQEGGQTHPLLPGIRCADVWDSGWPRLFHDRQITGFSPLTLDMREAPQVWATIPVGGDLEWVRLVQTAEGAQRLLVNDGRLRMVAIADGAVLWTSGETSSLVFFGDLRGEGRDWLLLAGGPRLALLDAATGETRWQYSFEPSHAVLRVQVADVLPERPGLEAAVFQQYGEEGALLSFPPEGEPEVIWQKTVVVPGEHPDHERADHGCDIRIDLSVPDQPVIWNVRHHRCRGFDARTGEMLSSLVYELGGGYRRNYGPWALGRDRQGRPLICVAGQRIQQHVHGILLSREGENQLAWQHYYGEVYVTPGVALECVSIDDVDGDGSTEIVYNVRDPEQGFRSFVRVRDGGTGDVEVEIPDATCRAAFTDVGPERLSGLLIRSEREGRGTLGVHVFRGSGELEQVAALDGADLAGPVTVPGPQGDDLLLTTGDDLGLYRLADGRLERIATTDALGAATVHLVLPAQDGPPELLVTGNNGQLEMVSWQGERRWSLPLAGGAVAALSAADLTGDGRAELVAAVPGDRLRVYAIGADGAAEVLAEHPFARGGCSYNPLLYDLEGDGRLCIVAPGRTERGEVCVRAFRADASPVWETVFEGMRLADGVQVVAWNAGQFLAGPRAGVAISVANDERTIEGTYMLEGASGRILWFRDRYRHPGTGQVRAYRPIGYPSAFDVDGDGVEEVVMDMYSFMAFLRGEDGSFVRVHPTINITTEGAIYAGQLYNSFIPVYRTPQDTEPHWFVPGGYGRFGLMNPDPTHGVWREDVGYDAPTKAGLIDVDGDGALEAGYVLLNSRRFVCRDLWSGQVEWEVELPAPTAAPVLCADFDGDDKGEFLVGWSCV